MFGEEKRLGEGRKGEQRNGDGVRRRVVLAESREGHRGMEGGKADGKDQKEGTGGGKGRIKNKQTGKIRQGEEGRAGGEMMQPRHGIGRDDAGTERGKERIKDMRSMEEPTERRGREISGDKGSKEKILREKNEC